METQLPIPKGHSPPNFRPISVVAKWLHGPRCHLAWSWRRPRPRRLCVRWGPRSHLHKRGRRIPQKRKLVHVYCGQTAGWMKLVLGMEVGLSPGDFVLDGDRVPFPQKGAEPPSPIFGPFLLWPRLRSICVRQKGKGKEEYLCSAFSHQGTSKALRHGSHSFTCKQHHACLSFVAFTRCHNHSN